MAERADGEPAFPVQDASKWQAHGMTLRDYFAAKSMPALIGTPYHCVRLGLDGDSVPAPDSYSTLASDAYELADAMLKARQS